MKKKEFEITNITESKIKPYKEKAGELQNAFMTCDYYERNMVCDLECKTCTAEYILFRGEKIMDERVIKWVKVRDFIEKNGIKYDKDGDPNFSFIAKSKAECVKMTSTYHRNWRNYVEYCKEFFGEVPAEELRRRSNV